jgi:hypothetical protein
MAGFGWVVIKGFIVTEVGERDVCTTIKISDAILSNYFRPRPCSTLNSKSLCKILLLLRQNRPGPVLHSRCQNNPKNAHSTFFEINEKSACTTPIAM